MLRPAALSGGPRPRTAAHAAPAARCASVPLQDARPCADRPPDPPLLAVGATRLRVSQAAGDFPHPSLAPRECSDLDVYVQRQHKQPSFAPLLPNTVFPHVALKQDRFPVKLCLVLQAAHDPCGVLPWDADC